jgi:uncharacterized protein
MSEATKQQLLHKLAETVTKRNIHKIKFRLAGGEPLSQFKSWKEFIPEAKRILQELGCELEIAFITNLTILNDEIIAFSKEFYDKKITTFSWLDIVFTVGGGVTSILISLIN